MNNLSNNLKAKLKISSKIKIFQYLINSSMVLRQSVVFNLIFTYRMLLHGLYALLLRIRAREQYKLGKRSVHLITNTLPSRNLPCLSKCERSMSSLCLRCRWSTIRRMISGLFSICLEGDVIGYRMNLNQTDLHPFCLWSEKSFAFNKTGASRFL